jgi:hypothetical protein
VMGDSYLKKKARELHPHSSNCWRNQPKWVAEVTTAREAVAYIKGCRVYHSHCRGKSWLFWEEGGLMVGIQVIAYSLPGSAQVRSWSVLTMQGRNLQ